MDSIELSDDENSDNSLIDISTDQNTTDDSTEEERYDEDIDDELDREIDNEHMSRMKNLTKKHNLFAKQKNKTNLSNENIRNPQTTSPNVEKASFVAVQCKDLIKGANVKTFSTNISVPKHTTSFVINLKRRNLKTISLTCNFGKDAKIVYQGDAAIITSNN